MNENEYQVILNPAERYLIARFREADPEIKDKMMKALEVLTSTQSDSDKDFEV